jgi:integration host factor subunit alpha
MFKKNLTRKHLSEKIYKSIGFSKNFSGKIIDSFFDLLVDEIIKSNKVKISSFGTFVVKRKSERIGRNPKTKVEVLIKPRKVVKFIPSRSLKEKIN